MIKRLNPEQKSFVSSLKRLNNEGLLSFHGIDISNGPVMKLMLELNIGLMEKARELNVKNEYLQIWRGKGKLK